MKLLLLALAASALAACVSGQPALASNIPVSGLPARGTPATTDMVPVLPVGATSLQQTTAGALLALGSGGSGVNLNGFSGVDPTGATDSTTAIQAAINTGQSLSCNGLYKISATLTLTTTANHGQQISGLGPTSSLGTPTTNRCVFQPTSALTGAVFTIDGTPVGAYLQGWGFENLTVDMTNMTDVATNIAFDQIQAFDGHYTNVRVINYGINKLSWQFLSGSYTTLLSNVQGGQINFQGTAFSNEATTITVVNSDITGFTHDYFNGVSFVGGAIQRGYTSAVPVIYVPPGPVVPIGYETTNTTGFYALALSQLIDSQAFSTIGADFEYAGGFTNTSGCASGQYNDGTHGCLTAVPAFVVNSTAVNTTLVNPSFSGMYLVDLSTSTTVMGANAGGGAALDRVNVLTWLAGYTAVVGGATLSGYSDQQVTQTFSLNASTGAASFQSLGSKPATNADGIFTVWNAAGQRLLDVSTTLPALAVNYGMGVAGFVGDFSGNELWALNDQSGGGSLSLYGAGATTITLTGANGTIVAGNIYNTPVGAGLANTGAFTTLSASSTTSFPTPSPGDNTTKGATTAFVTAAITAATANIYADVACTSGGCTVNAGSGVSSVTRTSAGYYQVNFTANFADTHYAPLATVNTTGLGYASVSSKAVGSLYVSLLFCGTAASSPCDVSDGNFEIVVFGR